MIALSIALVLTSLTALYGFHLYLQFQTKPDPTKDCMESIARTAAHLERSFSLDLAAIDARIEGRLKRCDDLLDDLTEDLRSFVVSFKEDVASLHKLRADLEADLAATKAEIQEQLQELTQKQKELSATVSMQKVFRK